MIKRCFAILRSFLLPIAFAAYINRSPALLNSRTIRIGIARTYFIAKETNSFKLFCVPSAWMISGCTGSRTQQRWIRWNWLRCCCSFRARFVSFIVLFLCLPNSSITKPLNFSVSLLTSAFQIHRFAHGPEYTRNSDDWLVEQYCSKFLQGSLVFFIRHLSCLTHHSDVCLCYKSSTFPCFDS